MPYRWTLTTPLATFDSQGCCGDGSKTAPTRSARCCHRPARLAELHTVSKATARHALEVLVKSGHARHIESKPHQVIWRQAGLKGPDSAVDGLTI